MTDALLQGCPLSAWLGDEKRCRWCNRELTGRQQRWCSDACPQEAIANHWWAEARRAAFVRDGERCVRCGPNASVPKRGFQVHHRDVRAFGRHSQTSCCHHLDGLETLCHAHHLAAHRKSKRRKAAA